MTSEQTRNHVTPIGLQGIDHVGVAVPELDEAIDFYQRTFGMTCVHIEENPEQGTREAMLQVGSDPSAATIQLLAPLRPDSPIGKFLARSGPGVQQVAYAVTDIDETCAALRERGVRVLFDQAKSGTSGSLINFIHPKDAGGVLIELIQPLRS